MSPATKNDLTGQAAAPTQPHPSAPDTPPENLELGLVAASVERVRDAMRSA
jgi:hypothetical protein